MDGCGWVTLLVGPEIGKAIQKVLLDPRPNFKACSQRGHSDKKKNITLTFTLTPHTHTHTQYKK